MTRPIRPVITVVLRLWREPGAEEGDAAWRGQIRPLGDSASSVSEFLGLEALVKTLRQSLEAQDASATTGHSSTEPDGPTRPQ